MTPMTIFTKLLETHEKSSLGNKSLPIIHRNRFPSKLAQCESTRCSLTSNNGIVKALNTFVLYTVSRNIREFVFSLMVK